MSRPIKLRVWEVAEARWGNDAYLECCGPEVKHILYHDQPDRYIITQFTGLLDSKGREIYEGDIVRYYMPQRSYQTHYGDNIPNGQYSEPLEPYIKTHTRAVRFAEGAFTFDSDEDVKHYGFVWPFAAHRPLFESREQVIDAFSSKESQWIDGGDDETGDCTYLCHEYGLPDESALIAHLNTFEVIGNIFEHSHLLK